MTKFHHAMKSWSDTYKELKDNTELPCAIGFKVDYEEEYYEEDRARTPEGVGRAAADNPLAGRKAG